MKKIKAEFFNLNRYHFINFYKNGLLLAVIYKSISPSILENRSMEKKELKLLKQHGKNQSRTFKYIKNTLC